MKIYRFVIKKTYIELLLSLQFGEKKIKECSNKIGMNYAHLTTVFIEFSKEGIINKIRKDNSFDVSLTDKGKRICQCLAELKKAIDDVPEEKEGDDNNAATK